jgi:hypothetical protein
MKWYAGPEGGQRIWYEPEDIEQIATEQLRRADLLPTLAAPVTDVERLIEGHLRAELDLYADLPEGVLGLTMFPRRGEPTVSIAAALTEARDLDDAAAGVVGRWRATLAHEASHIFLHRYLFDPDMAQLAGGGAGSIPNEGGLMRCLHRDISPASADWSSIRRRPDWREVQANRAMAALLMPRRVFKRLALQTMQQLGLGVAALADASNLESVTAALADIFQVSKQAAGIRLNSEVILVASDHGTARTASER